MTKIYSSFTVVSLCQISGKNKTIKVRLVADDFYLTSHSVPCKYNNILVVWLVIKGLINPMDVNLQCRYHKIKFNLFFGRYDDCNS